MGHEYDVSAWLVGYPNQRWTTLRKLFRARAGPATGDLLANSCGILAGLFLAWTLQKLARRKPADERG